MYEEYFDLKEPAFSIAVNPRYLFMSEQHKEALAHLVYGVSGGGFVMLTGEVGTGKTTIIRCLLEQLPEDADIAIILNPMSDRIELLTSICDELGIGIPMQPQGIKQLMDILSHYLLKNHERGRRTIVLIDEAQLLSTEALEQIRLLTNLETTSQKLLHIMLVGQPELKQLIGKPELRQLSQRITARFHLNPLTLVETQSYINHRLKIAGLPEGRSPFPLSVIKLIHKLSGGIPRLINVLSERCLLGAYALQTRKVTPAILKSAAKEVLGETSENIPFPQNMLKFVTPIATTLLVLTLGLWLYWERSLKQPSATAVSAVTPSIIQSQSSSSLAQSSSSSSISALEQSFNNYKDAENAFLLWNDFPLAMTNRPCAAESDSRVICEKQTFSSWQDLRDLDRPVILVLITPERFSRYLILVGMNTDSALLIDNTQKTFQLPLAEIGKQWTGEAFYLWTQPPGFENTLLLGDTGATVEWVSQQFAKIDKQGNPLTDDLFTLNLQERVKIFQRSQQIPITGNIDKATIQKLNIKLAKDKALQKDF